MKTSIEGLVKFSYLRISKNSDRANYITNELSRIYNKHSWSCLISNNYGARIWHINNIFYSYNYNGFDFIIFIGAYFHSE